MGEMVKTWRVLRAEGMVVEGTHRLPGDFVPEAANWEALRANVEARYIEEVWADENAIQANLKEVNARAKKSAAASSEGDESSAGEKTTKKTVKKKKLVRKKATGNDRRELHEQAV